MDFSALIHESDMTFEKIIMIHHKDREVHFNCNEFHAKAENRDVHFKCKTGIFKVFYIGKMKANSEFLKSKNKPR